MYRYLHLFILLGLTLVCQQVKSQFSIELVDSSQGQTSFRGLSVVTDKVVWVSGSKGTVGLSKDAGKSWKWMQIPGFEKSDFRDIEAFDKNTAIIMASGTPAVILKTTDGGGNWKVVFRDNRPEMFLDAMDFWDKKRGMLVGDPINGRFVLLETTNGGDGWRMLDSTLCPEAHDSEAVFAASGTSLRYFKYSWQFAFVTGGRYSRVVLCQTDPLFTGSAFLPMTNGKPSQGTFSFALNKKGQLVYVGGDYSNDTSSKKTFLYMGERASEYFVNAPSGYRSCVEFLSGNKPRVITTGTNGVDWCEYKMCTSHRCWECYQVSKSGYHVVRKAKKGKAVFLAGSKGRIAKLNY